MFVFVFVLTLSRLAAKAATYNLSVISCRAASIRVAEKVERRRALYKSHIIGRMRILDLGAAF